MRQKAYDLLVQSEAGLASITGTLTFRRSGVPIADIAGGMRIRHPDGPCSEAHRAAPRLEVSLFEAPGLDGAC
jgi:hypothetical protein